MWPSSDAAWLDENAPPRSKGARWCLVVQCPSDLQIDRARELLAASHKDVPGVAPWQEAIARPEVDLVVVATTNEALTPVATAAVEAGKHVLVEKPAARTVSEIDHLVTAARLHRRFVRVGLNHRYHPAFLEARRLIDAGEIGPLMFVRGRYGHGGRVGYEHEWRADPVKSGGGELIDQGVHLIDLAGWLLGSFSSVHGVAATFFWNMPVDDNAFLTLRTDEGQVAFLHASCSEWKNTFSFEIFGRDGKIAIDGLGGSYGVERMAHYRMLPAMGPPDTFIREYPAYRSVVGRSRVRRVSGGIFD